MKLKYIEETGELVCMGEFKDLEGAVEVSFPIPAEPLNHYTFNGTDLVRKEQSVIDTIEARLHFDLIEFQGDLEVAVVSGSFSNPALRSEFGALNTYAANDDFEGMISYMNWLVSIGAAIENDVTTVKTILSEQGVII